MPPKLAPHTALFALECIFSFFAKKLTTILTQNPYKQQPSFLLKSLIFLVHIFRTLYLTLLHSSSVWEIKHVHATHKTRLL